jgi:hypothetical protein
MEMAMLDMTGLYARLAGLGVAITLILCACFGVHRFLEHEQSIGYQKAVAEYTAKALVAEQAARAKETLLTQQLNEAQNAAIQREKVIRDTSAAAAAASVSLHDTLTTIRSGVSSASADALSKSVVALTGILDNCQREYRGVAEVADRHASDVKTLTDAWPK